MKYNSRLLNKIFLLLLLASVAAAGEKPYLSRMHAEKNDPVFATYTAAMERSEFTLDEGYHFLFYDSSRGIDFTTDTGGDLCLAFKRGAAFVYKESDLNQKPVITATYPDMVKYHYSPFPDVMIRATFAVYSSHIAIHDVIMENTGEGEAELQVIPFMQNNSRVFNDVQFRPADRAVLFTHEELPDGWMLRRNIPFVPEVKNVLMTSLQPLRQASYRTYRWGETEIPQQVLLKKTPRVLLRGKLLHPDGKPCRHPVKKKHLIVGVGNPVEKFLTEKSPVYGTVKPHIAGSGGFHMAMDRLLAGSEDSEVRVIAYCGETGESGSVKLNIPAGADTLLLQKNIRLEKHTLPAVPAQVVRDIWGSGTEVRLSWKHPSDRVFFRVFRRNYRRGGVYQLLADSLKRTFYTDKNIQGDRVYGYLIFAVNEAGQQSGPSREINNIAGSDFLTDMRYPDQLRNDVRDFARVLALPSAVRLAPGATQHFRIVRAVSRPAVPDARLLADAKAALHLDLSLLLKKNEGLFSKVPVPEFKNPDEEMLYWTSFNLMRQVMLPPEGKCHFNYYVFSREPTWGWGHAGQVFHESLTMLAYAFLDPLSAMNSQRVYRERQFDNGYIYYRMGSHFDITNPRNGQLTTSAPWYAWQNWEVYKITGDREFLKEMYRSSREFYKYYVSNRDSDGDGLCEWGGHAVLESVRDAQVAVWSEVGWPSNFEAAGLNSILVMEAKALAKMAAELGLEEEAAEWLSDAQLRAGKINRFMWDEETGFYYNIDKRDNDFSFKNENDLKRQEIIGFLPLWAGIASDAQAERLVKNLTNPEKFWRTYGVPSLAADDPYYNPKGYWNGPVWVEWNHLIEIGLLNYGYRRLADSLVRRVAANMISQLRTNHSYWEFYSPDEPWGGHHRQYIWAGIISRMFLDLQKSGLEKAEP